MTNIPVHIEMFVSLQDQPEHCHANFIMLGGGKYSAQWGHAVDFAPIASGIPACTECLDRLLNSSLSHAQCAKVSALCLNCTNWETDVESGKLDSQPPKDFPKSELFSGIGKLHLKKTSYGIMKDAVKKRNIHQ